MNSFQSKQRKKQFININKTEYCMTYLGVSQIWNNGEEQLNAIVHTFIIENKLNLL